MIIALYGQFRLDVEPAYRDSMQSQNPGATRKILDEETNT
jgi:hypothetical protein